MSQLTAKVKIRRAHRSDSAQIAELSTQLGYPATIREMAGRLSLVIPHRDSAVFVAFTAPAGVIGWLHVSVTRLLEVPLRAELNGLVVDDKRRSLGAGAMLLAAAERWAKSHGCKSVSVRSNVIRGRAHAFYERHGYEHYKTQKAFRKIL
jgi:GNAT superfamily N-acetyltransferase